MNDMLQLNKIHNIDALEGLKQLPDNFIDCIMTSPPYWALRDYGIEPQIWDACCGGRMMWFTKHHPNTMYIDIRKEDKGLIKEIPNFEVNPDIVMDIQFNQ